MKNAASLYPGQVATPAADGPCCFPGRNHRGPLPEPPPPHPAADADGTWREHHRHGDGVQATVGWTPD